MRWTALVVLLWTAPASAQTAVGPGQVTRLLHDFEPNPGDQPLRCEVTTLGPILNFAFRFEAGYTLHVPFSQYRDTVDGWRVLTTITPEDGNRQRTFLLARYQPSEVTKTELNFDIAGVYLLGVGRYSVEAALRDDRNRVCRKQWEVVVKPGRGDRVPSAMPPDSVRALSVLSWPDTRHPDQAPPLHLSLLLNAAAFSTRTTTMRAIDRQVLLSALTGMLEHLPTTSVRLVVFSLEQQREFFRSDDFKLAALDKVVEAINALQLATVDFHVLQKPLGHVDFLSDLVNRELRAPAPSDTVVFLGPPSRYGNRIPESALSKPVSAKPRFFYVQYQGPRRLPFPTAPPDSSSPQLGPPGGRSGGLSSDAGPDAGSLDTTAQSADTPHPLHPPSTGSGSSNGNSNTNGSSSNSNGNGGTSSSSGSGSGSGSGSSSGSGSGSGSGGGSGMGGGGHMGGRNPGGGFPPIPPPAERQTDIISEAMARLKGKTLAVHSPADLAQAIRKIEGR